MGKAQEAYIALSKSERRDQAVLKAYELVPEAYRWRFRSWRKREKQTHVEVARELTSHFNRWCVSIGLNTFEKLCNLMVLEQLKNIVPDQIATYINEQKVTSAAETAVLVDDLTHRYDNDGNRRQSRCSDV